MAGLPSIPLQAPHNRRVRGLEWMRGAVLAGLVGALLVGSAVSAEAFTLIQFGKPYVSVTPTSGLAAATFAVHGKYVWNGPCPTPASPLVLTFKFYWYKVITAKVLLWTKSVSTCTGSVVDTGTSPGLTPPSTLNYPSTFVIQVAVYSATGAAFGRYYTNTTTYQVLAPKPSPKPSPRLSPTPQCGAAGQASCASPTPSATACANPSAALPPGGPGGKDVATILALGLLGALPIGGIAMLMSGAVWSRSRQWPRLAALLAVTVVVLTSAAACTQTNQTGQASPSDVASPSPSPTPTC